MDDGVEAGDIVMDDLADVLVRRRYRGEPAREGAGLEQAAVEARDLVAVLQEHRRQDAADISEMTGEKYFHCSQFHVFQGALPLSQSV